MPEEKNSTARVDVSPWIPGGEEFVTRAQFDGIAKKHKSAGGKELLRDLHALGICLWHEDLGKFNTLVLNPEWISHGVYNLINAIAQWVGLPQMPRPFL